MAYIWKTEASLGGFVNPSALVEIRNNVNAERRRRGIGEIVFSEPILSGDAIKLSHFNETKDKIAEIKNAALNPSPEYISVQSIIDFRNALDAYNDTPGNPIYKWVLILNNYYNTGAGYYWQWRWYHNGRVGGDWVYYEGVNVFGAWGYYGEDKYIGDKRFVRGTYIGENPTNFHWYALTVYQNQIVRYEW